MVTEITLFTCLLVMFGMNIYLYIKNIKIERQNILLRIDNKSLKLKEEL